MPCYKDGNRGTEMKRSVQARTGNDVLGAGLWAQNGAICPAVL